MRSKYWYRGTLLSLTTSLNFLFLLFIDQSFKPIVFKYFSTFAIGISIFSLVKALLVLVHYTFGIFGLTLHKIITYNEPKGRFRPFLHFWPLSQHILNKLIFKKASLIVYFGHLLFLLLFLWHMRTPLRLVARRRTYCTTILIPKY